MSGRNPRVGVGCVVVHDGRLLLVRNRRGLWSTPGGHLDFGESPAEAAVRETLEETGVTVHAVEFVSITNDVMTAPDRHYVTIWMKGGTSDPTIEVGDPDEIHEAGWFDPAELPHPLQPFFENFLAGKGMPKASAP